jgi:hypothetical protein
VLNGYRFTLFELMSRSKAVQVCRCERSQLTDSVADKQHDVREVRRASKDEVVLSLANPEKLAGILLEGGFFSEANRLLLTCPYFSHIERTCESKNAKPFQPCKWDWNKVGANADCPHDQQLNLALEETRTTPIKSTLMRSMKFVLEELHGKHSVDIAVRVRELRDNDCFSVVHSSPSLYFVIFDLELKSVLKAIRYAHLLLANYSESSEKPQVIIITLNTNQQLKETLESQGIRVHVARWPQ